MWILAGLRWGAVIGIAGTLFLLAIGGIRLSEAPWFLGSWLLLGLLFGILVNRSDESEKSGPDRVLDKQESVASTQYKIIDLPFPQ